ncbi:MAG: hypothetical protein ACOX5S_00730 [Patescibacteria group bacterium]|jgi:glycosyltransferase involved in cell wall biosynthesis
MTREKRHGLKSATPNNTKPFFYEIIIVDSNSTDGARKNLQKFDFLPFLFHYWDIMYGISGIKSQENLEKLALFNKKNRPNSYW